MSAWTVRSTFPLRSAVEAAASLRSRLLSLGADVTCEERAGTQRYSRNGTLFALLRPLATRVDVGFSKLGRARSTRILDAKSAGLPFVRHRVIVEAPGDIDTELLSWLKEGYEGAGEVAP